MAADKECSAFRMLVVNFCLLRYRKERNITQEKLAEICNLHPTYIGLLEHSEKNTTVESIYRIAKGLNIHISKLLENIEQGKIGSEIIPLDIYQRLLAFPLSKQDCFRKILIEIIELIR